MSNGLAQPASQRPLARPGQRHGPQGMARDTGRAGPRSLGPFGPARQARQNGGLHPAARQDGPLAHPTVGPLGSARQASPTAIFLKKVHFTPPPPQTTIK